MSLTLRQGEILAFLKQYVTTHHEAPTVREIGRHFGIRSVNGVISHLKAMERRGCIHREPTVPRGIVVLQTG